MNTIRSLYRSSSSKLQALGFVLLGMMFLAGMTRAEDVPFPTLPPGAGPIDKSAAKTFTTTESGLKYRILRKGSGPKPSTQNRVEVNYHGWLFNGRIFDSSYVNGKPVTLGLFQVVKGWTEGLQLVNKGGMIELEIPGYLGYGLQGREGSIPPNATLHFVVELIDIKD